MVYSWKMPHLYPGIDAQTAGEELERIGSTRGLTPANVVEESRDPSAPLHPAFDWNDATAAEAYRRVQAGKLICCIATVRVEGLPTKEPVRAFVKTGATHERIDVALRRPDARAVLLADARKEWSQFQAKYEALEELADAFTAVSRRLEEIA